jgi:hypothetical protein
MKLRSGRTLVPPTPYIVPTHASRRATSQSAAESGVPAWSGRKKPSTLPPRSERVLEGMSGASTIASDLPLHEAVARKDAMGVRALVSSGQRPVQLDAQRRSPLDLLDSMDMDAQTRTSIRAELLRSRNPAAPAGYVKPEVFHGSPWGLEILLSGELKGGVNDPKGGSQSLEGQVFFSDRTPAAQESHRTRADLRRKPRSYAKGVTASPHCASARAAQHRAATALLDAMAKNLSLGTGTAVTVKADSEAESQQKFAEHLQSLLHLASLSFGSPAAFENASPEQIAKAIRLPTLATFEVQGMAPKTCTGSELFELCRTAAETIRDALEAGKAPFLSLINGARAVPVVFGFEKIEGLRSHTVGTVSRTTHAYQPENHPLAGSARGGRLKEIEVQGLQDLATLCLGLLARDVSIPSEVVIRVKPPGKPAPRATYLEPERIQAFSAHVLQQSAELLEVDPSQATAALKTASIGRLQEINAHLRNQALDGRLAGPAVSGPIPPVRDRVAFEGT